MKINKDPLEQERRSLLVDGRTHAKITAWAKENKCSVREVVAYLVATQEERDKPVEPEANASELLFGKKSS